MKESYSNHDKQMIQFTLKNIRHNLYLFFSCCLEEEIFTEEQIENMEIKMWNILHLSNFQEDRKECEEFLDSLNAEWIDILRSIETKNYITLDSFLIFCKVKYYVIYLQNLLK